MAKTLGKPATFVQNGWLQQRGMWCVTCREGRLARPSWPKGREDARSGQVAEVREVFTQDGDLSKAWWILGS